jgi:16S rRNA (guanine527-N7)-methyltransferase
MTTAFSRAYRAIAVPGGLPAEAEGVFAAWFDLLTKWNRRINLTRVIEPEEIVPLHLLDSLPLANAAPRGASLLDIGSGAGVPGLIVAALRPDLRVTCVESIAKKAMFLEEATRAMKLCNVRVVHSRAETLAETFDVVTARAVASPAKVLGRFGRLVEHNGAFALFLADESVGLPAGWVAAQRLDYALPGGHGERVILLARPAPE